MRRIPAGNACMFLGAAVLLLMPLFADAQQGKPASDRKPAESTQMGLPITDMPPFPGEEEIVSAILAHFPGADRKAVLDFLTENFRKEISDFRAQAFADSGKAVDSLTRVVREAVELLEARKKDPELFRKMMLKRELDRKAINLAADIQESNGSDKERLTRELHKTLAEAFDLKQEFMMKDLKQMEAELANLKGMIEKRMENRNAIIEKRLADLTKSKDFMEW